MPPINATLVNLYHVCQRELWLHAHGIRMESNSELVAEGKFIGDTAYVERPAKYTQVELDGVKIDFYDAKNGVVHEVKKSDKAEAAAVAQVQYYLWKLRQHGIAASHGLIEYPRQRRTERVDLSDADSANIEHWVADIEAILALDQCPAVLRKPVCRSCSYADYCYAGE
ncbi:MAG TPA: CRISPR-associated protein Cas4 [Saprospiraceae bacterium]|nr:CRISPR-associated protein Cas4 [Saprospiraceae bacterium]